MGSLALCMILIFILETISGMGFDGCECNFAGGCSFHGAHSGLSFSKITPSGIDQFAMKSHKGKSNLVNLCEKGTVAIRYDRNARIPLYAATVMTGAQIDAAIYKRKGSFRQSYDDDLPHESQPQNGDYFSSLKRNVCHETRDGKYLVNKDWYNQHPKRGRNLPPGTKQNCVSPYNLNSPIHKGHLIAASYGRGDPERIKATFTYTNSVPQFGTFNSGQWCTSEIALRNWAVDYCTSDGNKNARLFIVTGAVPSTFDPSKKAIFLGRAGFSDFQGISTLDATYGSTSIPGARGSFYRVNVPTSLWTVACCTFQRTVPTGDSSKVRVETKTRSTAFYRGNNPGEEPCSTLKDAGHLEDFFENVLNIHNLQEINLFPSEPSCYVSTNFIKLTG